MAINVLGAIVFLLAVFGVLVSNIGIWSFTNALKKEYSNTTYHMAYTASSLVNGDNLGKYLGGEEKEEYNRTKRILNAFCQRMHVSIVYVIAVDRTDYNQFTSIFNLVNNTVDDTSYTEWELGTIHKTTNDEYRQKYKALYEENSEYETVYRYDPGPGLNPHITTLVPVKSSDGSVAALLCIQRPISEIKEARRPYLAAVIVSAVAVAILASFCAAVFIRRQVVLPVIKVSDEATRFARENTKGEPLGSVSKYEEISRLSRSIDKMETEMVEYINNLTAVTAEKERIGTELSLAKEIQENSIPNIFPPYPEREEFDIFASMRPAKEVGGDFYNFFLIDEDHLAMAIGDVSGKGIPAALMMMVTNILINERMRMGGSPGEILTFVNNEICENNKAEMFVTVWAGILEISTGKLTAANAGHEDPVVGRKDTGFELFKTKHGLVAGAMSGIHYKDYEIRLNKGDKIFLYTDGIPEATDKDKDMFSLDRLTVALNRFKDCPPQEILEGIYNSVKTFVGDEPQFDDMTMLCVEIKENDE